VSPLQRKSTVFCLLSSPLLSSPLKPSSSESFGNWLPGRKKDPQCPEQEVHRAAAGE